jgi:ABC-type amino acid transport substrate-binding protein
MKKKLVAIALCSAFAFSMTACGASDDAAADKSAAETENNTEEGSAEASTEQEASADDDGILTMGTNAAFPPYEYYDGDTIVGIDPEIAALIADELGMELEIIDMDFSSIVTSVQTGKIDIGMAGMTVDPDRLENVNFSDSYATGVQVIIVPEDSDIASVDDLEGKLIGTQEGTTGAQYCMDQYGNDAVIAYTNGATAVQALQQGKVDCVVIDQQPAIAFVDANEGLKILETEYAVEDYAIAVAKENTDLLDKINAALAKFTEDGSIQAILDKYIVAE